MNEKDQKNVKNLESIMKMLGSKGAVVASENSCSTTSLNIAWSEKIFAKNGMN